MIKTDTFVYVLHSFDGKFIGVFTDNDKTEQAAWDYRQRTGDPRHCHVTYTACDIVTGKRY